MSKDDRLSIFKGVIREVGYQKYRRSEIIRNGKMFVGIDGNEKVKLYDFNVGKYYKKNEYKEISRSFLDTPELNIGDVIYINSLEDSFEVLDKIRTDKNEIIYHIDYVIEDIDNKPSFEEVKSWYAEDIARKEERKRLEKEQCHVMEEYKPIRFYQLHKHLEAMLSYIQETFERFFSYMGRIEIMKEEAILYSLEHSKVLDRQSIIMYADSLMSLKRHLQCLTDGVIDDISYEEYAYPCVVVIKEYKETDEPWDDVINKFVNVQLVSDYLDRVKKLMEKLVR